MSRCHSLTSCEDLKLGVPVEVSKYAKEFTKKGYVPYSNDVSVSWIQKIGKRFLCRTFAIRKYKNGSVTVTEIRRQFANETPILCHTEYRWMGGWVHDHGAKWTSKGAYRYWGQNKNGGPFIGKILNMDAVIDKYFPYCAWYQSEADVNFWEYIQIYMREPKVELLCKAGYSTFVTCIRCLNTNEKSLDKILKVKPKWVEYLKGKSYYHLMACRKSYVKTEEDADAIADVYSNKEALGMMKYAPKGMELQMCHYLHGQAFYKARFYNDYLTFRKELGYPLHERKYLFPDNLDKAHDEAWKKIKEVRDAKTNALIKEQCAKLMGYHFTDGDLLIRPAESCDELIEESKQMNNCVRTYAESYAKGLTAIFFIRHVTSPDKSYVTLELKNKNVKQVYGFHNSKPDATVMDFVKNWKREFALT